MCVIIHKPAEKVISEKDCRGAFQTNRDGFGFMYFDKAKAKIVANKAVFKDIDKVLQVMDALSAFEVAYHFRIKTHGSICDTQCHPFRVLNKEEHGQDIYMMHNGVISGQKGEVGESDTQMFVNGVLRPMLAENPDMIKTRMFKSWVEHEVGGGNRLLFMYGDGKTVRINDRLWDLHEGMSVSNRNFTYYQDRTTIASTGDMTKHSHSSRFPEYDVGFPGARQTPNFKNKESLLSGEPVHVGDQMFITHRESLTYYCADAKVTSIDAWSCTIQLKDKNGIYRSLSFFLADGSSTYRDNDGGYQCMRMSRWINGVDHSIESLAKLQDAAKTRSLSEKGSEMLGDDSYKNLPALEDLAKKKTSTVSEPKNNALDSCNVSHGSLTVDANNRWGEGLENSLQAYQTGTTILDVENMAVQDRFDFFVSNPEDSFAMFQDLVEKLVREDVEAGIVEDATEVEKAELKQNEEDAAHLEEMAMAAGMMH